MNLGVALVANDNCLSVACQHELCPVRGRLSSLKLLLDVCQLANMMYCNSILGTA